MADRVGTVLHSVLQFQLDPGSTWDETVVQIERVLLQHGLEDRVTEKIRAGTLLILLAGEARYSVQAYQDGLVTVDLVQTQPLIIPDCSELQSAIVQATASSVPQSVFAIRKGVGPDVRYGMSLDGLLLDQFTFTRQLYTAQSPYQHIAIYHSVVYGACLFLDHIINIADSDYEVYGEAMTGNGRYDMTDRSVLLLGNGDGGVLRKVLDKSPKRVVMIELDVMVIEAARTHLRGTCGNALDQLTGDNYEIIIGDCTVEMKQLVQNGDVFDYIIYDLTDIPHTPDSIGDVWDFTRLVLDLSMKLLAPNGRYIAQGDSSHLQSAQLQYEEQLGRLPCKVEFTKESVSVPSFKDFWTFYTIWKTQATTEDNNDS